MASETEILKIMAILTAAYPNSGANDGTIPLYARLLSDIPGELLQQAAFAHIATSKFFPTIAELRQAALDVQEAADPLPDAHAAWGEVLREMDRVGWLTTFGETLQFSHPLIAEVVHLFGWQRLCASENTVSDRAQFLAAYTARLDRYRQEARWPAEVMRFVIGQRGADRLLPGGSS